MYKSCEKADSTVNCEVKLTVPCDIHVKMTCILDILGIIVQSGLLKQELPPSVAEFLMLLSFTSRSHCRTHSLYSNCQYMLVDALI